MFRTERKRRARQGCIESSKTIGGQPATIAFSSRFRPCLTDSTRFYFKVSPTSTDFTNGEINDQTKRNVSFGITGLPSLRDATQQADAAFFAGDLSTRWKTL